jgi:hypothetical protein
VSTVASAKVEGAGWLKVEGKVEFEVEVEIEIFSVVLSLRLKASADNVCGSPDLLCDSSSLLKFITS